MRRHIFVDKVFIMESISSYTILVKWHFLSISSTKDPREQIGAHFTMSDVVAVSTMVAVTAIVTVVTLFFVSMSSVVAVHVVIMLIIKVIVVVILMLIRVLVFKRVRVTVRVGSSHCRRQCRRSFRLRLCKTVC